VAQNRQHVRGSRDKDAWGIILWAGGILVAGRRRVECGGGALIPAAVRYGFIGCFCNATRSVYRIAPQTGNTGVLHVRGKRPPGDTPEDPAVFVGTVRAERDMVGVA